MVMDYLEYLKKKGLVCECSALLEIEMEQVNECMRQVLMTAGVTSAPWIRNLTQ